MAAPQTPFEQSLAISCELGEQWVAAYSKLGVTSRSAATRYAMEHHLA